MEYISSRVYIKNLSSLDGKPKHSEAAPPRDTSGGETETLRVIGKEGGDRNMLGRKDSTRGKNNTLEKLI